MSLSLNTQLSKRLWACLLIIFGYTAVALCDPLDERITWKILSEDLEQASIRLPTSIFTTSRMDLFRTSLKRFDLRVARAGEFEGRTSTAKDICIGSHATLCINGSFFDEQRRPLGLLIEKGNTFQKMHRGGNTITGVVQKTKDGVSILHRLDFQTGKVLEALQAGPRLISNGQPVTGLHENATAHRRSGVCVDPDRRLILYTVTGNVFGVPISKLQKLLLHRDIACWDALNLDGGSSTQLYYSGTSGDGLERPPFEIKGEDEVPVFLTLIPQN